MYTEPDVSKSGVLIESTQTTECLRDYISGFFSSPVMTKKIIQLAVFTILVLLIPLALTIRDGNVPNVGWNWSPGDFVFAFVAIFGMGLAYILVSRLGSSMQYRAAVALGIVTAFFLLWINAAVGLIGDGDINILYGFVLLIGFFGGIVTRFKAERMQWVLFAAAIVQMAIPVIAFILFNAGGFEEWFISSLSAPNPSFSPGVPQVFMLNAVFASLFTGSGMLFRQAAEK